VSRQALRLVDGQLDQRLVERFTDQVFTLADLPRVREDHIRSAPEFWLEDRTILGVTCTITGSSYERPWDGSEEAAIALADEAADGTAYLVTKTRHYAWLRSRR
jgi:hypothetical protein